MTKTFYGFDRDGVLIGSFEEPNFDAMCDETPPFCTDIAPPELTSDQQARFIDGRWEVEPKPTYAPVEQSYDEAAAIVRTHRNTLLAACDYTQLPDVMVDREAWGQYRNALRNISEQPGFPFSIAWPTKPT